MLTLTRIDKDDGDEKEGEEYDNGDNWNDGDDGDDEEDSCEGELVGDEGDGLKLTMMLFGLRSRCTTPAACMSANPRTV